MTRVGLASVLGLVGCGFSVNTAAPGDAPNVDMPVDMVVMVDAPVLRVTSNLIGFWTFDEPNTTAYAFDTSGATPPVPLEVIRTGSIISPTFVDGTLDATNTARLVSAQGTHLAGDCRNAGAATLEVWVQPSLPVQGTMPKPTFIAGLATDVALRDIALMQGDGRWIAHVRTGSTSGMPNLVSTSAASTSGMTHLVVVADAATRTLYVNGQAEASSTPGSLSGWDPNYPMTVVDEWQHARQWRGSVALVALYSRALSAAEVSQNFAAGSNH